MEVATRVAPVTTLIAGLGGQGVVLAGDALCEAALRAGLNVKKSEIHGLSRRFGSVSCQIRTGSELYSPVCGHGGVNIMLALEGYEALKNLPYLQRDGVALVNRMWRKPGRVTQAEATAPPQVRDRRIHWFEGSEITHQAECPGSLNFFMLGVLSCRLEISEEAWMEALLAVTPAKALEANREMFQAGRRLGAPSPERRVNSPQKR